MQFSFPNVSGIKDLVIFHLNILDGVKRRYKDTNDTDDTDDWCLIA